MKFEIFLGIEGFMGDRRFAMCLINRGYWLLALPIKTPNSPFELSDHSSHHTRIELLKNESFYLADLSRWGQPGQQQGLFLPFRISSESRKTCAFLVSDFLTIVTQQIHSLRARAVNLFQLSSSSLLARKVSFRSSGISCTVPDKIMTSVIQFHI